MTITQFPTHTPMCAAVWDDSVQGASLPRMGNLRRAGPLSTEERRTKEKAG